MQRTVDMTVGSPTKHILKFSLPLIAANMGQQLYAIADASIVVEVWGLWLWRPLVPQTGSTV